VSRRKKDTEKAKDGEQKQYEKFLETAKEIGASDDEAFEDAIKKILKAKPKRGTDKRKDQ
jgi:hypothetical protein